MLVNSNFQFAEMNPLCEISKKNIIYQDCPDFNIYNLGVNIDPQEVNWHKDYISDYQYPARRFDEIKPSTIFNKGVDVKFAWELSRFYFGLVLAQRCQVTGENQYYIYLKDLLTNFIKSNPFLYGVNWVSPMEVGMRSVNWILALNLVGKDFFFDTSFKKHIAKELIQSAEYINAFPEIYYKGHTTNHTIACYTGLIFLALSLKDHPSSLKWLNKSIKGLETCIQYQVYNDGINFEASIPYHRLSLELFSYPVIFSSIRFSDNYYKNLFRMFEFTAAYIDSEGNAPQVGDNDSGKLIVYQQDHYKYEHNHSYLLTLGEHIFNYKFKSQCLSRFHPITSFLPDINKIDPQEIDIVPRSTNKSIHFQNGGAHLLKQQGISLLVSCFPIGQKGRGGHNHLDTGSFTLSMNKKQIVVDPGTFTYTRSKQLRDKFRAYDYHNTLYTSVDRLIPWDQNSYWSLNKYYNYKVLSATDTELHIAIKFINDPLIRFRHFILSLGSLTITDTYSGAFFQRINLHPHQVIIEESEKIISTEDFSIKIPDKSTYNITDYDYSPHYDKTIPAKCIIISSEHSSTLIISPSTN